MKARTIVQIVLVLAIAALIFLLWRAIVTPIRFDKDVANRKQAVIERIIDIRSAERGYKQLYSKYTGTFDELIRFVLNDSLTFERTFGSLDDSVAVAQNLVRVEQFKMAAIDTIFGARKLSRQDIERLRYIPFSGKDANGSVSLDGETDRKQFILAADTLVTESKVTVPVFECKAPYKDFLYDLDHQELVNLIDETETTLNQYPGIKAGSLEVATNDAGNWE